MSASPRDRVLEFADPAVEADFRGYQDRGLARICGKNMVTAFGSWLVGHIAIAILAPEHLIFMTIIAGVIVYPFMIATMVLGPRATTTRQHQVLLTCVLCTRS